MLPDSKSPAKAISDDNKKGSGNRKSAGYLKPPEQGLKCPRCDSPNTKFCYYNNYSLSQPRHFCKSCKRYWTNGGAMRSVPIGGGSRKNKKTKSNSRLSCDSKDSSSSSETNCFKNFYGVSPIMEFQHGEFPFSRLNSSFTGGVYNQFSSAVVANSPTTFNTTYPSASSSSIMGMNYLSSSNVKQGEIESFNNVGIQGMSSMNFNTSLASSIESLSCMNQDLHWRLQQQRFAEMLSEENHHRESSVSLIPDALLENQVQRPEPIFFQNLEISKPVASAVGNTGECFFDNSSYTPTSTTTFKNGDENTSNWSGFQAWNDVHQYGALP